jgi:hypothetical protein
MCKTSISHQQAVAEHWDLPNTEIFQSVDVTSVPVPTPICKKPCNEKKTFYQTVFVYINESTQIV